MIFLNLKQNEHLGFMSYVFNKAKAAIGFRNADPKEIFKVISYHWETSLGAALEPSSKNYKPFELNQPIYYKDVLTSEWKPSKVLHWRHEFVHISTGNEKP